MLRGTIFRFQSEGHRQRSHVLLLKILSLMYSKACALPVLPSSQGNTARTGSVIGELAEHVMCVWCIPNYDEEALPFAKRTAEFELRRRIKERIPQAFACSV